MRRAIQPEINMHARSQSDLRLGAPCNFQVSTHQIEIPQSYTPKHTPRAMSRVTTKPTFKTSRTALSRHHVQIGADLAPQKKNTTPRKRKQSPGKRTFSAYNHKPCNCIDENLPMASDLKYIKRQIDLNKPKTIHWGNSDDVLAIYKDFEQETPKIDTSNNIIRDDDDEIDINMPPKAVHLISTTAGVMDYIGLPNSLSFIR